MVPVTAPADLDVVDRELAEVPVHPRQLVRCFRGSGDVLELVPVDPRHQGQFLSAADRAVLFTGPPVELGGSQEVWARVADIVCADASGVDARQQRSPL